MQHSTVSYVLRNGIDQELVRESAKTIDDVGVDDSFGLPQVLPDTPQRHVRRASRTIAEARIQERGVQRSRPGSRGDREPESWVSIRLTKGVRQMDEPRAPHTPQEPNPPDPMEGLLIDEITQFRVTQKIDPLRSFEQITLETASPEALIRQAERYDHLAHLYRRLAELRVLRTQRGEAGP